MNTMYIAPMQIPVEHVHNTNDHHYVGSYSKTVFIRTTLDKFISFDCIIEHVNANDYTSIDNIVKKYLTCANIVVDDDSKVLISRMITLLDDNFLIYNSSNKCCLTIYEYIAKIYDMQPSKLNLYQMHQLIDANILLTLSFKTTNVTWNSKIMIDTITEVRYELFCKVIQRYLERIVVTPHESNKLLVKQLIEYITSTFVKNIALTSFKEFEIKQITNNDLYNAIKYIANI